MLRVSLSHFDKECEDDSKTQMMMQIKLKFEDNVPLVPETIISLKFYSTSISSICGELHWREWENQNCFLIKLWNYWFFYKIYDKPCYTKANFAYFGNGYFGIRIKESTMKHTLKSTEQKLKNQTKKTQPTNPQKKPKQKRKKPTQTKQTPPHTQKLLCWKWFHRLGNRETECSTMKLNTWVHRR